MLFQALTDCLALVRQRRGRFCLVDLHKFFFPKIQSLTEPVQISASTVTPFFQLFLGSTLHPSECGICSWSLMILSSHGGRCSEWIPSFPLPLHLSFNKSLSYHPCGSSSVLENPSTGCFLSSSHSETFIILANILQAFSISITAILEVGSEHDTRATWIYALMLSVIPNI